MNNIFIKSPIDSIFNMHVNYLHQPKSLFGILEKMLLNINLIWWKTPMTHGLKVN